MQIDNIVVLEPTPRDGIIYKVLIALYYARIMSIYAIKLAKDKGYESKIGDDLMNPNWIFSTNNTETLMHYVKIIKTEIEQLDEINKNGGNKYI